MPTRGEGDHPVCTTAGRKIGDTPRVAPKGLGIDGQGAAGPASIGIESAEGCHWHRRYAEKFATNSPQRRAERLREWRNSAGFRGAEFCGENRQIYCTTEIKYQLSA